MVRGTVNGLGVKARRYGLGLVLLASLVNPAGAQDYRTDNSPLNGAIAGYSPGGVLSVIGEGITAMVRAEYPGSSLVYEPGNPIGGLMKVAGGERLFAIQSPQSLRAGLLGLEPFREKVPQEGFRVVAKVVQGLIMEMMVREDFLQKYQVKSMADIAARKVPLRISVGQPGNMTAQLFSQGALGAYGLDYRVIESFGGEVFQLASQAGADLLRNNRADIAISGGFAPSALTLEVAASTDIRLLPVGQKALDRLGEFGFGQKILPASTYKFLEGDVPSPTTGYLLVAGPLATDAEVYKLVKSLHRQFDYYRSLHATFADFSPAMLVDVGSYPLHPVARTYYQDVGLIPEGL